MLCTWHAQVAHLGGKMTWVLGERMPAARLGLRVTSSLVVVKNCETEQTRGGMLAHGAGARPYGWLFGSQGSSRRLVAAWRSGMQGGGPHHSSDAGEGVAVLDNVHLAAAGLGRRNACVWGVGGGCGQGGAQGTGTMQ